MVGSVQGIRLEPRDLLLLRGLFEARVMNRKHISALFFDDKSEMAKKRLQRLKAAGYVRERRRHISEEGALFLTAKSFRTLHEAGELAMYPRITPLNFEKRSQVSDLTLLHELEVMDVKVWLTKAIATSLHLSVDTFTTWPKLSEFKACRPGGAAVVVKPDAYLRVIERRDSEASEQSFFIELDRSTESLSTLWQRCQCYLDYYRSGGYARQNGGQREDFKAYPFRVLIVCKSTERVNNVAEALLKGHPPIRTMVWLTSRLQVESQPLGKIWIMPGTPQSTALFE